MAPIVLPLLQGLFLLLLYLFVWRIARAILRDLRVPQAQRPAGRPAAPAPAARKASTGQRRGPAPSRAGAPAPSKQRGVPRELVVHRAGGAPRVLPLDGQEITFGRAAPATVVLDDPYVSDRHARVAQDATGWIVTDLGSTNGTFLNQVKVTRPTPLAAGDQLGIGKTTVEVRR